MKFTYLSTQAVFSTFPKSQDKNLNILRMKRAFKMKYKLFFITFEGLSLKQKKGFFLEGESPTLIRSKLCNVRTNFWRRSLNTFRKSIIKTRLVNMYVIVVPECFSVRFNNNRILTVTSTKLDSWSGFPKGSIFRFLPIDSHARLFSCKTCPPIYM